MRVLLWVLLGAGVIVCGATSAGVAAAMQPARIRKTATVVEPGTRPGGLTTGGLSWTDIGNKQVTGGIAHGSCRGIKAKYDDPKAWVRETLEHATYGGDVTAKAGVHYRRERDAQEVAYAALRARLPAGGQIVQRLAGGPRSPIPTGAAPKNEGAMDAGEGPAWHPEGGLYFTGRGKISRRERDGTVSVFRRPPGGANGLLFDLEGRLVSCETGARRVTRTEADGTITVLADAFEGKRFNSPNDLSIDSKGRIYFSDPRYGSRDGMELDVEGVYRIDAPGKVARVIGREVERANGVLVAPGDTHLYVADNNNNRVGGARKLWRFRLRPDGAVDTASRELVFDWQDGRGPDGVKMDSEGRLFVAAGLNRPHPPYETAEKFKGGIYILDPAGTMIDFVPIPADEVTNCTFGGADLKTLYITAGGTLWSIPVNTPGWARFPRR
jgi:gluconolactonase